MKYCKNYLKISILTALLMISQVYAADICVENSTQLYLFLSIADSNNQDDHIKIATGSYPIKVPPFTYDASETQETFDLKISGGWTTFAGNPCGQQLATSNFDTILDGEDENLILSIEMAGHANLEISNLFFFNGNGPGGVGGALRIDYPTGTDGEVLIENNLFKSNTGNSATALWIDIADTTTVRNNTFFENHAMSHIIRINSGSYGTYFTNNTVLSNTNSNSVPQTAVYLQTPAPSQVFVANNVLWDNDDSDLSIFGSGDSYFKNNNYQSLGSAESSIEEFIGNFTLDPQFQPIGPINTQIPLITSPLVNAGIKNPTLVGIPPDFDETWYVGDKDVRGNDRIIDGRIDIGAYEVSVASDIIFENGFE